MGRQLVHFPRLRSHFDVCPQNGITHTLSIGKESVTVTWEAPSNLDTDVVFLVTVVQKHDTFWVKELSEKIKIQ